MNILSVENLSKRYGERLLFEGVSFGLNKGDKVSLVARNGTGKTSLMRALAGIEPADEGEVVFRNDLKIGYLPQEPPYNPDFTVDQTLFIADNPLVKAIQRYELSLESGDQDEMQQAFEEMDRLKAWDYESNIKQILGKLKINRLSQKMSELSGGQRRRVALAKVLIDEQDVLILDEPTNHLDLEMIEWLEQYLSRQSLTLFMVTHDRYFLDRVCTDIIELEDGELYKYKGNYGYFLEKKEERHANAASEVEKAKNLMRKELEWMRRQPKARGTKSKARIDAFYDLKSKAKGRKDDGEMQLQVNMERLGSKIVELHHVGKGYGDLELFEDFHYRFNRKERVGIIGANGTGKSTFLNLITGKEEPSTGKVVIGDTIKFGYYTQQGIEFDDNKRVIEIITDIAEVIPGPKGRMITAAQMLERFLFPRHQHYQYVSKLSGGEKRRLYLLTVLMDNPNFLILDEPTNDLDLLTLNVLEEFLFDYEGCLVIVTHDRYFMDKLVDHLFVFEGEGQWRDFPGNYSQFREEIGWKKKESNKEAQKASSKSEPQPEKEKVEPKSKPKKLSYNEKREYEQLGDEIEKLEQKKAELTEALNSGSDDHVHLAQLGDDLQAVIDELDAKELRWLELDELA